MMRRGLATVFSGRDLAKELLVRMAPPLTPPLSQEDVRQEVTVLQASRPAGWQPRLVAIAVGNHPASK